MHTCNQAWAHEAQSTTQSTNQSTTQSAKGNAPCQVASPCPQTCLPPDSWILTPANGREQVEEARKTAEERHQEGRCALTDELEQVKDELKQVKGDLTIKCTELSFANEDIKGLESQLQQLAQSSSDNLALPLPAAAPAPAGDKDVEGGGADQGPVSEFALPKVGKTVGLGFTFKRDSRSGNWQVSPAPLPSVPPSLPPSLPCSGMWSVSAMRACVCCVRHVYQHVRHSSMAPCAWGAANAAAYLR